MRNFAIICVGLTGCAEGHIVEPAEEAEPEHPAGDEGGDSKDAVDAPDHEGCFISISVIESESEPESTPWYGQPLDLYTEIRVGFHLTAEEHREPVRRALAWFEEAVSTGFNFVWVDDAAEKEIEFVVNEELDAIGYCTGCCNGAARTAQIVLGSGALRHAEVVWLVAIHEVGHALGLPHILPSTWRSVMNRTGPFSPTDPYADGELDVALVCALHQDALGCFEGDEEARQLHLATGFQDRDGPVCPEAADAAFMR